MNSTEDAALLKRTSDFYKSEEAFSFFSCQYFQISPAGPQLETSPFWARGCLSESAHFLLLVCVFDGSSSAELPHTAETKWKTQLLLLMNKLTVWQEKQMAFPKSLLKSVFSVCHARGVRAVSHCRHISEDLLPT